MNRQERTPEEIPTAEEDRIPPPLCVFCSAPWTDDMVKVLTEANMEHGYYNDSWCESIDAVIDVTCSSCNRLVYRKEFRGLGVYG